MSIATIAHIASISSKTPKTTLFSIMINGQPIEKPGKMPGFSILVD
jgi:hypothetical protein